MCSPEELTRLLNDKDAYNAYLHSLDDVRRLDTVSTCIYVLVFFNKGVRVSVTVPRTSWEGSWRITLQISLVLFLSVLFNVPFLESLESVIGEILGTSSLN